MKVTTLFVLLALLIMAIVGCGKDQSLVTVETSALEPIILWKSAGQTVYPDAVDSVKLSVSYSDVTINRSYSDVTINRSYSFNDNHAIIPALPSGKTVDVLFEGIDGSGVVVYRGNVTGIELIGERVLVTINAEEVTPISPSNINVTAVSSSRIRLNWTDNSSNEDGFIIWRNGVLIDTTISGKTTYNDTGLNELTAYTYFIKSFNAAGVSLDSLVSSQVTTLALGSNSAPAFPSSLRSLLTSDTLLHLGMYYSRGITATDSDEGDSLHFTASQQFSGLPDSVIWEPSDTGIFSVWVKVTDDSTASDSIGWRVRVADTTTPPDTTSVIKLDSGLVAWYPFNGNTNDESGKGINLSVNGAVLAADRHGNTNKAYYFDGQNDYLQTDSNIPIAGNADRTVCTWIKLVSYQDDRIVLDWGTGTQGHMALKVQSSKKLFLDPNYADLTRFKSNKDIEIDQWYFAVFTFGNGRASFYINGILDTTRILSINTVSTPLSVGFVPPTSDTGNRYWYGWIDDIRIYNRILTVREIDSLYRDGG